MLFRRIICILLAVLTISLGLPLSASAAENGLLMSGSYTPEYRLAALDCSGTEDSLSKWVDVEEFKAYLLECILNANFMVDITSFDLPYRSWIDIVNLIFYGMPEAFGVYDIQYSYDSTQLYYLHLGYRDFADTPEEYAECFREMTENADRLLSGVENNAALSDVEKALLLHDRLCVHNEYPFYDRITEVSHTAYGALAEGSSVCQGYAMAYMYLLDRVGIKNYYASSEALNHAWNIVYIDGKPYHVDVTFDDINWVSESIINVSGGVHHKNFLVCTKTLRSRDHFAFDFDNTPTDTKYDNYYWGSSDTEFQLINNKLYYINNETATLMCEDDNKELVKTDDIWMAEGNYYWVGNFSCLTSAGADLFISLSDSIYKYNVETGESVKILEPYLHQSFSIYGLTYKDGKLIYDVNTEPPGGDTTFLKREAASYDNVSHIVCSVEVSTDEVYYIGDSFRPEKTVVTAHYSDGSSEIVTDGVSFSGFDSSSDGKKTVVVSYKGFEASLEVEIKSPFISLPESISINQDDSKELRVICDPEGLSITWKSSSPVVQVDNGRITGKKNGAADVTAEITYNGKTYSAVCQVIVNCIHKNKTEHERIPPTADSVGYTEGVFCDDCKKYISGHTEIPKIEMSFSPSDFMTSDGTNVRIIVGKLIKEMFWSAPAESYVTDKDGKTVDDSKFVATGMILVLPDGSKQEIVVMGDTDGDGELSASDARTALRTAVSLESFTAESPYFRAADVDKDNVITAGDARCLLRASVGLDDNTLWL